MSLAAKLLSASGGADKLYVDDVFSAYTYTGNGSTQTINNGIDLAGEGGLVWIKRRDADIGHFLIDTDRGADHALISNATIMQSSGVSPYFEFTNTGPNIKAGGSNLNTSGASMTSWTFRKAPKFFDVVTYTGNGVAGRQIPHELGIAPGMVVVKKSSDISNWAVYHRSMGAASGLLLNIASAKDANFNYWHSTEPTDAQFSVANHSNTNQLGQTYVAYLFAHDPSADGIIQCGSFTTDGSGNATVNHGWTAGVKFAMIKASSTTGDWEMFDTARTPSWSSSDARLKANLSNSEDSVTRLSASGTSISFTELSVSASYVYVFIVAPT